MITWKVSLGNMNFLDQTFVGEINNLYDVLKIQLPDGTPKESWFDITEFYGK